MCHVNPSSFQLWQQLEVAPKVGTVVVGGVGVGILTPSFNAVISIRVSDKDLSWWEIMGDPRSQTFDCLEQITSSW